MADVATPAVMQRGTVDWLDGAALAYLALPNLIFLAGWLKPEFGWPAAAGLAVILFAVARTSGRAPQAVRWGTVPVIVVVAAIWVAISGVGHLVYANSDWVIRDAVLVDLVRDRWPVTFQTTEHGLLLLRAPLAYYLPAAIVGWVAGLGAAQWMLALWTWMGVTLSFMLFLRGVTSTRLLLIRMMVFIFFSGMDILGLLFSGRVPLLGAHMEWWAQLFQYSSDTTQLFWVPNHALPGWIAIAWLLGRWPANLPIAFSVAMVGLAPMWSPLTAVGLVPIFFVALVSRGGPTRLTKAIIDVRTLGLVAILAVFVYPYLLLAGGTVPSNWLGSEGSPLFLAERYAEFLLIEYLILFFLMVRHFRFDPVLLTSGIVLGVLPLYRLGPYSDFTMRASIPALTVIAILLGKWFAERWSSESAAQPPREDWGASVAMILFVIGVATPFQEMARSFIAPQWDLNTTRSTYQAGYGTHYFSPRDLPWANQFLR